MEMFRTKRIRRFEMAYSAESYYGDTLTFCREQTGDDAYDIEVKRDTDEVACRSKVIFD